jgi:hypothetical protein
VTLTFADAPCYRPGIFGLNTGLRTRQPYGVRMTVSVSTSTPGSDARSQRTSARSVVESRANLRIVAARPAVAASGPGSWPGQSTAPLNQLLDCVNWPAESRRTNSRTSESGSR